MLLCWCTAGVVSASWLEQVLPWQVIGQHVILNAKRRGDINQTQFVWYTWIPREEALQRQHWAPRRTNSLCVNRIMCNEAARLTEAQPVWFKTSQGVKRQILWGVLTRCRECSGTVHAQEQTQTCRGVCDASCYFGDRADTSLGQTENKPIGLLPWGGYALSI